MALPNVDRGHPAVEPLLGARQKARLVVDVNVAVGREADLHLRQAIFFVRVHEDVPLRRESESRARDLQRLVDPVPVRNDYDRPERPEVRDDVQRSREQIAFERNAHHRPLHLAGARLVR